MKAHPVAAISIFALSVMGLTILATKKPRIVETGKYKLREVFKGCWIAENKDIIFDSSTVKNE